MVVDQTETTVKGWASPVRKEKTKLKLHYVLKIDWLFVASTFITFECCFTFDDYLLLNFLCLIEDLRRILRKLLPRACLCSILFPSVGFRKPVTGIELFRNSILSLFFFVCLIHNNISFLLCYQQTHIE